MNTMNTNDLKYRPISLKMLARDDHGLMSGDIVQCAGEFAEYQGLKDVCVEVLGWYYSGGEMTFSIITVSGARTVAKGVLVRRFNDQTEARARFAQAKEAHRNAVNAEMIRKAVERNNG